MSIHEWQEQSTVQSAKKDHQILFIVLNLVEDKQACQITQDFPVKVPGLLIDPQWVAYMFLSVENQEL